MAAPRQRTGLGRGLGDLIRPTTPEPEPITAPEADDAALDLVSAPAGASFGEIPVDQIVPNPKQPRQVFDEDDLSELDSLPPLGQDMVRVIQHFFLKNIFFF